MINLLLIKRKYRYLRTKNSYSTCIFKMNDRLKLAIHVTVKIGNKYDYCPNIFLFFTNNVHIMYLSCNVKESKTTSQFYCKKQKQASFLSFSRVSSFFPILLPFLTIHSTLIRYKQVPGDCYLYLKWCKKGLLLLYTKCNDYRTKYYILISASSIFFRVVQYGVFFTEKRF